jgi:hypothetical protein
LTHGHVLEGHISYWNDARSLSNRNLWDVTVSFPWINCSWDHRDGAIAKSQWLILLLFGQDVLCLAIFLLIENALGKKDLAKSNMICAYSKAGKSASLLIKRTPVKRAVQH